MNKVLKTVVALGLGLSLASVAVANPNQGADAKSILKAQTLRYITYLWMPEAILGSPRLIR